ncbi:MAG: tRNA-(ms[2]io[6]A)-hydroxylase [Gammaproteobacteria bacterium]|nr:tRNA-(ms[2]io[6]A)-hydroxylase [Gammaproteobacteria bacterium]
MSRAPDIGAVRAFLGTATPDAWVEAAVRAVDTLLIDHANCEKKAAGTAIGMLYRYDAQAHLLAPLARLAREELRHFEEVLRAMRRRDIAPRRLSPSRYAGRLFGLAAAHEPARLVDTLIAGAIVEARSCERFALLAARLDGDLGRLYAGLLASEARHFETYLALARSCADAPVEARAQEMLAVEGRLVTEPDRVLRFHSGPPNPEALAGESEEV